MKFGKIVGMVLLITILVYSAITIFGTQTPKLTGILFFVISFILSTLYFTSMGSKQDRLFIIFEVLIICITLSFLLGSAKVYYTNYGKNRVVIESTLDEINQLSSFSDYYSQYATYLNTEINKFQTNNAVLEKKIIEEQIKLEQSQKQQQQIVEPVVQEPVVIYEDVYESGDNDHYEHEEYDDD